MEKLLSIVSRVNGKEIPFNVRVVEKGEKYGRDFCLTHEKDEPLVEFYDNRYNFTEFGQFVSRYCVSTTLERKGHFVGLCLDGGVPDWNIDALAMQEVIKFLEPWGNK